MWGSSTTPTLTCADDRGWSIARRSGTITRFSFSACAASTVCVVRGAAGGDDGRLAVCVVEIVQAAAMRAIVTSVVHIVLVLPVLASRANASVSGSGEQRMCQLTPDPIDKSGRGNDRSGSFREHTERPEDRELPGKRYRRGRR